MRTVPVGRIGGSVGRCSEFDRGFMPAKGRVKERWRRGIGLSTEARNCPPVSLYDVGGLYFVVDSQHRVSVARSARRATIETSEGGGVIGVTTTDTRRR